MLTPAADHAVGRIIIETPDVLHVSFFGGGSLIGGFPGFWRHPRYPPEDGSQPLWALLVWSPIDVSGAAAAHPANLRAR